MYILDFKIHIKMVIQTFTLRNGQKVDNIIGVDEKLLPKISPPELNLFQRAAEHVIPKNETLEIHTKMNGDIELITEKSPSFDKFSFNNAVKILQRL